MRASLPLVDDALGAQSRAERREILGRPGDVLAEPVAVSFQPDRASEEARDVGVRALAALRADGADPRQLGIHVAHSKLRGRRHITTVHSRRHGVNRFVTPAAARHQAGGGHEPAALAATGPR